MNTAKNLDNRLDNLMHEIKEIKKELILERIIHAGVVRERSASWNALGKKVSTQWDKVSAVDEIAEQREKNW